MQDRPKEATRLGPTLFNNLVLSNMIALDQSNEYASGEIHLDGKARKHSIAQVISYREMKVKTEGGVRPFYVFQVTKDDVSIGNERQLPYVLDVINIAQAKLDALGIQKYTLLIPMRQCRGFANLFTFIPRVKREHIVLVEIEIDNTSNKIKRKINVHDSQSKELHVIYPDTLKGIFSNKDTEYQYHPYDIQHDDKTCGHHVAGFINSIIENGHNQKCKDIKVSLEKPFDDLPETLTRDSFVITKIEANLSSKEFVIQDIEMLSSELRWNQEHLKNDFLKINENEQRLSFKNN